MVDPDLVDCLVHVSSPFCVIGSVYSEWMMADSELSEKLSRQQKINEGEAKPVKVSQSVYAEFKEFSIPEIKEFRKTFVK